MSTPSMTRLDVLRAANVLGDALHVWRNVCETRYGVSVRHPEHNTRVVILAGAETRSEQCRRHEALVCDYMRRLERAGWPS